MSWLLNGQRTVASASASTSVLPMNIQSWFPSGLIGLIALFSKGLSRVFSSTAVQMHQSFGVQLSLLSNSHPYMTTGKTMALTVQTFVSKVMTLLLKTLSSFVIAFLPRSNHHYPASNLPFQQECPGFPLANYHPQARGEINHLTQPGVQSILLPWPPQLVLGMGTARPFLRGMATVLHQFWDAVNDKMYPYLEHLQKRKKSCQVQL